MKSITEEWLDRAREDQDVALEIISREHLTNMVAFHSQQAVEKTLKGIIEEFEIGFVKTHNLERLLGIVTKKMKLDVDQNFIKRLDEVYINRIATLAKQAGGAVSLAHDFDRSDSSIGKMVVDSIRSAIMMAKENGMKVITISQLV